MSRKTEFSQERKEDVISGFPDEILCHILSFLPSSEAVRAGILSTRWRNLWASVATFDIEDTFLFRIKSKNKRKQQVIEKGFLNYVQNMINRENIPPYQKNRENISGFPRLQICASTIPANIVCSWVISAIKHNIKHIDLCFDGDKMVLPAIVFTSTSLEVLKLKANHLEIRDSVRLPSLKVFHLDLKKFGSYADLDVFLSNFPALEELRIKRYDIEAKKLVFNISLPKLKRLHMEFVDGNLGMPYKLVINAPILEYLHLKDYLTKYIELTNHGSLAGAYVEWNPSHHDDDHCDQVHELIDGIRTVKSLSLASHTLFVLRKYRFDVPVFNYLNHLQLDIAGDFGCQFLSRFLPCVPELETLDLDNKVDIDDDYEEDWSPPDEVPECLSLNLREIVVNGLGEDHEVEVVEYLLKHSQVLKKLTVKYDATKATKEETEAFFEKLMSLPCGSATCEITLVSYN